MYVNMYTTGSDIPDVWKKSFTSLLKHIFLISGYFPTISFSTGAYYVQKTVSLSKSHSCLNLKLNLIWFFLSRI